MSSSCFILLNYSNLLKKIISYKLTSVLPSFLLCYWSEMCYRTCLNQMLQNVHPVIRDEWSSESFEFSIIFPKLRCLAWVLWSYMTDMMFLQVTFSFYHLSDTSYTLSSYSLIIKAFSKLSNYKQACEGIFKDPEQFKKEFSKLVFPMCSYHFPTQHLIFSFLPLENQKRKVFAVPFCTRWTLFFALKWLTLLLFTSIFQKL